MGKLGTNASMLCVMYGDVQQLVALVSHEKEGSLEKPPLL